MTEPRQNVLPTSLPPRGLSRVQAAAYCGISASTFDKLVRGQGMPKPARCGRRLLWDKRAIDRWLDALFNDGGAEEWSFAP
jgi:predicted DNA-binding transcriptional regulator AlpA